MRGAKIRDTSDFLQSLHENGRGNELFSDCITVSRPIDTQRSRRWKVAFIVSLRGLPELHFFFKKKKNLELCSLSRRHSLLCELITLAVATILLDPGSQPRKVTVFQSSHLTPPPRQSDFIRVIVFSSFFLTKEIMRQNASFPLPSKTGFP